MSRLSLPRAAVVAAAAFAIPAGAFAQTPAAPPVPHAATSSSGAPTATQPMTASTSAATTAALPKDVAARVETHIKELHDQLGITAAEQPQWDQFAQVMRDNAAQMGQVFSMRAGKLDSMSAADNMQSYAQVAQVHATNMQKLASAFQALYTSFPDQQKQTADSVFRATGGRPPVHPKR